MDNNTRRFTLKALRAISGLTQDEAAKRLKISPQTLSAWENGTTFPTVPDINKIEALYNASYEEIDFLTDSISV